MTIYVRDLPEGQRFVLVRTGKKYRMVCQGNMNGYGGGCFTVEREPSGIKTTLHHSCHVKPIVRVT